jgi:ATP-dependent RNA helicase DDX52/ROK1
VNVVALLIVYLSHGLDIIISTPLRLIASLQEGHLVLDKYILSQYLSRLDVDIFHSVRHLVLDEADRLLDTEFLEQIQEINEACTHPSLQRAMFSATLPAGVEKIAMSMLQDPIRLVVGLK